MICANAHEFCKTISNQIKIQKPFDQFCIALKKVCIILSVNIKQSNIFFPVECDGVGETGSESGLSSVKPVPEDVLHQQRLLLQTCDRLKLSVSRYTMLQQV